METKLRRAVLPPIGVTPKFVLEERRFNELKEAIGRYIEANWPIPSEILWEYNAMANRIPKEKVNDNDGDSFAKKMAEMRK